MGFLCGKSRGVARCTIERLYREQGRGCAGWKKISTTIVDPAAERSLDRVDRQCWAGRPDQLWVADASAAGSSGGGQPPG